MASDDLPLDGWSWEKVLPGNAGTYALLLRPEQEVALTVGKLGPFCLAPGLYAYVGSARGPGGIRARVTRHIRNVTQIHWHIDTFTHVCPVESVLWLVEREHLECRWVQALLKLPASRTPIPGFGSSDCANRCPSHLVELGHTCRLSQVMQAIRPSSRSAQFTTTSGAGRRLSKLGNCLTPSDPQGHLGWAQVR
jgi:Uri superfamily endonuclease